jgi:hypothetical protein
LDHLSFTFLNEYTPNSKIAQMAADRNKNARNDFYSANGCFLTDRLMIDMTQQTARQQQPLLEAGSTGHGSPNRTLSIVF